MSTGADNREPIAVIGIGCRFPGGAVDPAGDGHDFTVVTDSRLGRNQGTTSGSSFHDENTHRQAGNDTVTAGEVFRKRLICQRKF